MSDVFIVKSGHVLVWTQIKRNKNNSSKPFSFPYHLYNQN